MRKFIRLVGFLVVFITGIATAQQVTGTFLNAPGSSELQWKIATLPVNDGNDYDHLHILVTVNSGWSSHSNAFIDATFGNRGGFLYQYTLRGSQVSTTARLVAYQNTSGGIDIYVDFPPSGWTAAGYTILESQDETIYNPTALVNVGSSPSGTKVFDSSSSAYPPSTYSDFSNNFTFAGNVKLSGSGTSIAFADGTIQSTAWAGSLCGGDYAESVDVSGDRTHYEPGDVLVIDVNHPGKFLKSNEAYSTFVTGIYSTKPGVVGRRQTTSATESKSEVPMAMIGIVPTKVSAENGPIKPGDFLVTSSTLGYAMKGTDRGRMFGAVVGKALGSIDSGTGMIEAVVSLQ